MPDADGWRLIARNQVWRQRSSAPQWTVTGGPVATSVAKHKYATQRNNADRRYAEKLHGLVVVYEAADYLHML
ncbi:MAG: hypothetical protein SNJ62_11740 [Chloracidobacterium sp.]